MNRRAALLTSLVPLILVAATPLFRPLWRERTLRAVPRPLDVLLITLDTTRADRLGCYGYRYGTSPNLDGLARKGVLFRRAYAPAPLTSPSHASIMTAVSPVRHGVHDNGIFVLDGRLPTLAERFVEAGYRTGAFVSAFVLDRRFGLARGFAAYEDDVLLGGRDDIEAAVPGQVTVDRAIAWIERPDSRPLFAWVHLYDPHAPYQSPEPFASRFRDRPYDGEVAYMDAQIGRLLAALALRGRPTLVAAVGDHGESLGDHQEGTHSYFIYSATQRVPLLLSLPGYLPERLWVEPVVRLVDVMPTLLDIAGLSAPEGIDGRSLAPLIAGRSRKGPGPAYLESYHPRLWWGARELRGLRTGPWLFIQSPRPELYDVESDPGEVRNLASQRPTEVESLGARLRDIVGESDPLAGRSSLYPEVARRLQALGYVSGAVEASKKAEEDLPDAKDNAGLLLGFTQGTALVAEGRWREALGVFESTLKLNPRSVAMRGRIAEVLMRLERYEEAFNLYAQLDRESPDVEDYTLNGGLAVARLGRKQEALELLRSGSRRFPRSARIPLRIGLILMDLGRTSEAESEIREAVTLAPRLLEARLALGAVLSKRRRPREAAGSFRAVIEASPHSREGREAAKGLMPLAGDLVESGEFEEARQAYRAAIQGGMNNEEVYSNLGLACHRLGRRGEALEVLQEGLRKLPDSELLRYRAGRVLQESGRMEEAAEEYRKALELNPASTKTRKALASLPQLPASMPR